MLSISETGRFTFEAGQVEGRTTAIFHCAPGGGNDLQGRRS